MDLQAKFWRVAGPRADGSRKAKAAIAVAIKILIAACYIVANPGEVYRDLRGDFLLNRDGPERRRKRLVAQLAKLGYEVDLTPATPPPALRRLRPHAGLTVGSPVTPTPEPARLFTCQTHGIEVPFSGWSLRTLHPPS